MVPPVDAVQEFKVKTNNFSAEFGHAAGAVINATIKTGTNQLHGSIFEFLRNNDLDANNFFTNAAGLPRAPFHQNQFGGAAGGPVTRNKTFFFADCQGTRQATSAGSSIRDVPPAALPSGDFSKVATAIYDPGTRQLGPNGVVRSKNADVSVFKSTRLTERYLLQFRAEFFNSPTRRPSFCPPPAARPLPASGRRVAHAMPRIRRSAS